MEGFPYPITVNGKLAFKNNKPLQNKLQIYFQSKKKSLGGDCVVELSDNDATVYFKTKEIRDAVISKNEHKVSIDKEDVDLTVSIPFSDKEGNKDQSGTSTKTNGSEAAGVQHSAENKIDKTDLQTPPRDPPESNTVILEKVPDKYDRELLKLLVETSCDFSEDEFHLEFLPDLRAAAITFKDCNNTEKFLKESKNKKKFQHCGLKARVLEKSTSIKVENLSAGCNDELLELYFGKHGGAVKNIRRIPEEQAAVVLFKEPEAVQKIIGIKHLICSTPVNVYPFFSSLGSALYGEDRSICVLPTPFTEKIHPSLSKFLHQNNFISSICDHMDYHLCKVSIKKDEVLFSPHPDFKKQKGLTKKQIDSWKQSTSDAFKTTMSKFAVLERPVDPSLWSELEKDIRSTVKDKAVMEMEASTGQLTLAGMTKDINLLKPSVEKFFMKASQQKEWDKVNNTEGIDMSHAMFLLLQQEGLQQNAAYHQQLKLKYSTDTNQLVLVGCSNEISKIKTWILMKQVKMKRKTLKVDPLLLEFLRSVDLEEMSVELFLSQNISVLCKYEVGDVVLTGCSEQILTQAEEKLKTILFVKNIQLEDVGLFEETELQNVINQLQDKHKITRKKTLRITFSKENSSITVSGLKEPVMEATRSLEKFTATNLRTNEVVRLKSHAVVKFIEEKTSQVWRKFCLNDEVKIDFDLRGPVIKISGKCTHVQAAVKCLKQMAEDLHTDTMTIYKAGIKKLFQKQGSMILKSTAEQKFVVVLKEHVDDDDDAVNDFGEVTCEVQTPGGIIIRVMKADMCRMKVDAVVNAANEDLKHSGGLALALLKAAGPSLQDDSDSHVFVNGRLNPGEAITTQAGRLPCQYVVHVVGPRYYSNTQSDSIKILRQAVRASLKQASLNNCTSIAMPAISSGIFGFPLQLCTETIAKELREYTKSQQQALLKKISLVDIKPTTVWAMAQAVQKEFGDLNPKTNFPQKMGSHGTGYEGCAQSNHYDLKNQHKNEGGESDRRAGGEPWMTLKKNSSYDEESNKLNFDFEKHLDFKILESLSTQEGIQIILQEGNIQDAQSDVIVNTVSPYLDLSQGAVSKALLQAAGPKIQEEAKDNIDLLGYSKSFGDIVVTAGYNLKCKQVFHTVCPYWSGGAGQEYEVLKGIIQNCLKRAERQKMTSISFPALGAGNLRFPRDLICKILLGEIHTFSSNVLPDSLKKVTVIVHPSDQETVQCFKSGWQSLNTKGAHAAQLSPAERKPAPSSQSAGLFQMNSNNTSGTYSMKVGHLTLEVLSGDITKEKCDAIVNSSDEPFTSKAGVSKIILDAAGSSVQQECLEIATSSKKRDVIITRSGRLLCGHIIHCKGQYTSDGIKTVVYSALMACKDNKISSVAFPALGTGLGGLTPSTVADAMIDAVAYFETMNPKGCVRHVRILIFQKHMMSDFHKSIMKRLQNRSELPSDVKEWEHGFEQELRSKSTMENLISRGWTGGDKASAALEEIQMVHEEPVVFQLCGETMNDLKEARKLINNLIQKYHKTLSISDSVVCYFGPAEAEFLNKLQRKFEVSIQQSRRSSGSEIILQGLASDVDQAEKSIKDLIHKTVREMAHQRNATTHDTRTWRPHQDHNDQFTISLPRSWNDMKGRPFFRVCLQPGSSEYTEVMKLLVFKEKQILAIERIQNETLYKNFIKLKRLLENKNKNITNERQLFHSNSSDKIDQINESGFKRSIAGNFGNASYGKGVYFSVDPNRSAKPDKQGVKRLFLARVLVGKFTRGDSKLYKPPAEEYDSVTDNTQYPNIFVIFNEDQAYPEYLITYQ